MPTRRRRAAKAPETVEASEMDADTGEAENGSEGASSADDEVSVVYLRVDEVERWPRNPKKHDLGKIERSMRRHGFVLPITRDTKTGRLVAGHGRLEVLQRMMAQGQLPPKRVKVADDGMWMVPVLNGIEFATEADAEDYLLTDNRLVELGGWDPGELKAILDDQMEAGTDVGELGWTADDLRILEASLEVQQRLEEPPGEQPAEEPPEAFRTFDGTEKATVNCPRCGFHIVTERKIETA